MENQTSTIEFHILPFFINADGTFLLFNIVFFFLVCVIGILVNIIIMTVICVDPHLHTPMYLFLYNLSIIDTCYITLIVPKLLHILLSGNNTISFAQCFTQMYFFFLASITEATIIFVMAYDRYVAICHPLHYLQILNRKICILIMMVIWICPLGNSYLLTNSILRMSFCSSRTIHQLFCDGKAVLSISCSASTIFYFILSADYVIYGASVVVCNLLSYVQIIRVVLRIKSKDGRWKAFSTCSSHLILMVTFYVSGFSVYMIPASQKYHVLEQVLTIFYTTVVPMLNPFIYSLRNQEIKSSLRKLVSQIVVSVSDL